MLVTVKFLLLNWHVNTDNTWVAAKFVVNLVLWFLFHACVPRGFGATKPWHSYFAKLVTPAWLKIDKSWQFRASQSWEKLKNASSTNNQPTCTSGELLSCERASNIPTLVRRCWPDPIPPTYRWRQPRARECPVREMTSRAVLSLRTVTRLGR